MNQGLLEEEETRGILPGFGLGNGPLRPEVWEGDGGQDKPAGEKEKDASPVWTEGEGGCWAGSKWDI